MLRRRRSLVCPLILTDCKMLLCRHSKENEISLLCFIIFKCGGLVFGKTGYTQSLIDTFPFNATILPLSISVVCSLLALPSLLRHAELVCARRTRLQASTVQFATHFVMQKYWMKQHGKDRKKIYLIFFFKKKQNPKREEKLKAAESLGLPASSSFIQISCQPD